MNRQQKAHLAQELGTKFSSHEAAFVVKCQGLTVPNLQELRYKLETKNGELKVAKNRLMKLAMNDNDFVCLVSFMKGQTGVVFVQSDYTGVAKVLYDFAKAHKELEVVAGYCESRLFEGALIKQLASIPSRAVLLSRLCGVLNAPVAQFVWILSQVVAQKGGTADQIVDEVQQ